MNLSEDCPAQHAEPLSSLPRTTSTADFSKLFATRSRKSDSRSHRSSGARKSESNGSENSQILYMTGKKLRASRESRQSLSSISNASNRRFDGTSEDAKNRDADDQVSWDIIDREIFEWQYVCQTGRPYWWSPESRYTRLKKLQPIPVNDSNLRIWTKELDDRPKPAYTAQRRAVSDNYFCDPSSVHDLAHMIAVQLLGACFTLPPGHILSMPSPHYAESDNPHARELAGPRMISSLRMHTHFRYSPSFGHQARNTSPVPAWPRSSGRTSPRNTPEASTLGSKSSSHRNRRSRYDTDGSHQSVGSESEHSMRSGSSGKDRIGPEASRHWRPNPSHEPHHGQHDRYSIHEHRSRHRTTSSQQRSWAEDNLEKNAHRTKYSLQPVIRSEPHHVFIQPVRELVVRRWKDLKRRMSGSLHGSLPEQVSENYERASPAETYVSDRKSRRLRAQERGDIHSSSTEGTPHYNSPVSGNMSPVAGRLTSPRQQISLAYQAPLPDIAQAARAAARGRAETSREEIPIKIPQSTSEPSLHPGEPGKATPISPRPPFPLYSPARSGARRSSSFASRARQNRERRKSMLSEVYTPDDVPSPDEGAVLFEEDERHAISAPATTQVNSPYFPVMPPTSENAYRYRQCMPRLQRTSTSGTQVFTPSEDGTELDGLPVGPSQKELTGEGRRERSYL